MSNTTNTGNSPKAPLAVSVTKVVAAPAEVVYDLVADITRMPEYSPENIATAWLGGATGPAVGVRFKGTNQLGKAKWSTKPTITVADPGRQFSFKVPGGSGPEWTYTFTPEAGGTRVTESMRQAKRSPLIIRLIQRKSGVTDRSAHLREGMNKTLQRLATAAERTAAHV